MTVMSTALLNKLKASLNDPDAEWAMASAVVNKRVEQILSGSGDTLTSTNLTVNNDSYRLQSNPLNLQLIFITEYTPDTIRSIAVTFQGVSLTTTDAALLTTLQTMAGLIASAQDIALQAALTLPS